MAIYRFEKKSISRGQGHNLVAAIAYRSGKKLTDENELNPDARTHDYTKKTDIAHSEIILPDELAEQLKDKDISLSLYEIANLVEKGEVTKRGKMKTKAKLASEIVLAGSHEISREQNIKDFQKFSKQLADEQGVIVMCFVHDPKLGNDMRAEKNAGDNTKTRDERNIHAHIIMLSRKIELTDDGNLVLGKKSDVDLSDTERKKLGLNSGAEWLKNARSDWADIQNESLIENDLVEVSHLSYKERGLDIRPGIHLGKHTLSLENDGIYTYKRAYNDEIDRANSIYIEQTANSYIASTEFEIAIASRRTANANKFIDESDRWLSTANSRIEQAKPTPFNTKRRIETDEQEQEQEYDRNRERDEYNEQHQHHEQHEQHNTQLEQKRLRSSEKQRVAVANIDEMINKYSIDDDISITDTTDEHTPTPTPTPRTPRP